MISSLFRFLTALVGVLINNFFRIIRAFLVEEQKIVKKVLKIQKAKEKQASKSWKMRVIKRKGFEFYYAWVKFWLSWWWWRKVENTIMRSVSEFERHLSLFWEWLLGFPICSLQWQFDLECIVLWYIMLWLPFNLYSSIEFWYAFTLNVSSWRQIPWYNGQEN